MWQSVLPWMSWGDYHVFLFTQWWKSAAYSCNFLVCLGTLSACFRLRLLSTVIYHYVKRKTQYSVCDYPGNIGDYIWVLVSVCDFSQKDSFVYFYLLYFYSIHLARYSEYARQLIVQCIICVFFINSKPNTCNICKMCRYLESREYNTFVIFFLLRTDTLAFLANPYKFITQYARKIKRLKKFSWWWDIIWSPHYILAATLCQ